VNHSDVIHRHIFAAFQAQGGRELLQGLIVIAEHRVTDPQAIADVDVVRVQSKGMLEFADGRRKIASLVGLVSADVQADGVEGDPAVRPENAAWSTALRAFPRICG
jgi:hypothetical protein